MRFLRRTIHVPVLSITPAGIRIDRLPVTIWLCRHDDGTTTHLAPWPPIPLATHRSACS